MAFHLSPVRSEAGQLRVNFPALTGWFIVVNSIFMALVYHYSRPTPSRQLRHPAGVLVNEVTLRSVAADEMNSSTVEVLAVGDTVDVLAVQANGWCRVTLPNSNGRGGTGYIQRKYLGLADSAVAALQP